MSGTATITTSTLIKKRRDKQIAQATGVYVNSQGAGTGVGMSAASILLALLGVDGTGSGLDADKLDGLEATAFAVADHAHDTDYISVIATPTAGNFPVMDAPGELQTSTYGPSSFAAAGHDHSGVYAAASHNHDAAYVSVIAAPVTGQFAAVTAGGEITNSGYDASSFEAAISKSTGYLRWTGAAFEFKNETYSLSNHNHSGTYAVVDHAHDTDYISVIATPTAGNFPVMDAPGELQTSTYGPSSFAATGHDHSGVYAAASHNHDAAYVSVIAAPVTGQFAAVTAGGEITNSGYDASSFEAAISKSTGYLRWTGAAFEFKNETYSLSNHNHSGTYEADLGTPAATGYILSSTDADVRSWVSKNDVYTPFQALTDDTTITWNMASGYNAKVTLAGNRTLSITNASNGMNGCLLVTQDGTGSRTLALPSGSKVIGGGIWALSTGAGKVDMLTFSYDGTSYLWSIGKNYLAPA